MAIIVLAIHDVRAPGKQTDVLGYLLKFFRLGVDHHDGILGRVGEVEFLILRVRRCSFKLNVHADPDASCGPKARHIVDVNEPARGTDPGRTDAGRAHDGRAADIRVGLDRQQRPVDPGGRRGERGRHDEAHATGGVQG